MVLENLQQENKKFENKMLVVMAISTILAIAIIFLLPLNGIKDVIIMVMVIAMAFIANTLNIVALAMNKEISNK